MLKKIIILLVFCWLIIVPLKELKDYKPLSNLENCDFNMEDITKNQEKYTDLIEEINQKNSKIVNFSCSDVELKLWENNKRIKLKGTIDYCKPIGFRMQVYSFLGKELDLGSNEKIFWYWSKRDPRPGVYWSVYEDFPKTRLKTPFNPMFIRATLGLEKIDLNNCKITENEDDLMLTYPQSNSVGDPIQFSILINKKLKVITGFLISNNQGEYLAVCEIQSILNNFPNKILYTWKEEKKTMSITLNNPQFNVAKEEIAFKMPDYIPQINMADE